MSHYLKEDEQVLHIAELDVQMADGSAVSPEVKDALKHAKNYYTQRPNTKLFGMQGLPVSKWVYCHLADTNSNMWNNYIHRIGQAPVIYDEERSIRTVKQLNWLLESKGCFGSKVSFDTISKSRYRIGIRYNIKASRRYMVDEVTYHASDPTVNRLLREWSDEALIYAGMPYDQEKIAAERSRIVGNLREAGYYRATPEMVTFEVDTTYSSTRLSIDVLVDSRNLQVYHINNIFIYPNSTAGLREAPTSFDTLIYTYPGATRRIDYQFVYSEPMSLRPVTISRALMLFPGMTYRPRYITNTYNSLLGLRNFKYINIDFTESPSSTDSLPLVDAHVRLINTTQQRLSLSLELTNASPLSSADSVGFFAGGNLGIETSLEYQHRNLFHGAELLKVKGSLLLELPKFIFKGSGGGFYDNFSAFEASLETSLDMPVFLLPFSNGIVWQRVKPHTLFTVGGSYQYHYYFERVLANTSFGYSWQHDRKTAHQLLPVELTFVRILNLDESFAARLNNVSDLRMKYQYSSHFILAARYDYTHTTQQYGTRQNFSFFHFTLESAGNLLSAIGNAVDAPTDSNGVIQTLGVPFSQYERIGVEWSRYHYVGNHSTIVARLLAGVGLPYGNSLSMPYEKSFYGGGPTTMRAWQLRHLGPGSYNSGESILERVGDLQLVLNLEGRFPIAGVFEGAVFADMGNVWLFNSSQQYADGEIKWSSFPSEVAVGVGLGLRVNVSIATLRVDFAIPLYDPGYSASQRWRPPHWAFNQIVTNFGIGYPF